VTVLFFVALAFQVDSFAPIKRTGLAAWQKIVMGLAIVVFSPLLPLLSVIPSIIRLPVLPCKILLGMDIGVLTFEVRFHRSSADDSRSALRLRCDSVYSRRGKG
jgi:hypothetical protein